MWQLRRSLWYCLSAIVQVCALCRNRGLDMNSPKPTEDHAEVKWCVFPMKLRPRKIKVCLSANKVIAISFWDTGSIIPINFFKSEEETTANNIRTYWTSSLTIWRRKDYTCYSKKCSFISTIQEYKDALLYRNIINLTTNCSLNLEIFRIGYFLFLDLSTYC